MTNLLRSIFNCYFARLHTLPGAPALRIASREQIEAHHRNLKSLNADKIRPRFGPDPSPPESRVHERKLFESACHLMLALEDNWQQSKLVWSWIDERPVQISPTNWREILPDPDGPTLRQFRLSLLGGGQIWVSENFITEATYNNDSWLSCPEPGLRVSTDAGDGLRHYTGIIDRSRGQLQSSKNVITQQMVNDLFDVLIQFKAGRYTAKAVKDTLKDIDLNELRESIEGYYGMGANAVLFTPGAPQSVVDRTAQTFRLLTSSTDAAWRRPDPDNFMALLDRSEACCVCQRPLPDHVSTLLGIDPDCARQWKLPHNIDAANRVLPRRKELLGEASASQNSLSD